MSFEGFNGDEAKKKLRSKVDEIERESQKENQEAQIIYGLPFINIIEQGLDVYSQVFKNELQNNEINNYFAY